MIKKYFIIINILLLSITISFAEDWNEEKSPHFIIYYKTAPYDFVKNVREMAEDYYETITRDLGFTRYEGWSWDERCKIYIYEDKADYVSNAKAFKWASGVAKAKEKVITTFPSAIGFFDTTLPHELGHIIFREFVGYKVSLPLWLEEGVAMYQEKAKRWGSNRDVIIAIKNGSFMTLNDLSKMRLTNETSQEKINLFYSESASIVYYMIKELGPQRFVNFCRKLEESNNFELALQLAYGRFNNIEELNKVWVDYLTRIKK